ncbi:SHOCT domain-containing protein [Rhodohalobacter sulfatireducens]|uniref:SHOCT domain-containing protein n=1 Tax=Rhodohalobacter sulfatireducens TaxID=2911366 RepID=A0ABS9K7Y2_9BACT|nr:SHOCT domain-containing protein [Rhodohalobacter sulfatireducens]MCG2586965.1 SHOCT domain-containing protein [Rhodohalobacter sulfatireducens]MDR9364011.1 SHOCT domain-containing protein [Balneolaceae bacterium]MDR9407644.1 SHOCT domain-containing protein [Balneolaceae bacterium]
MHDFQFFGGGWMMFFWWFLIIALVIILIRAFMNTSQNKQRKETPMDILKRRYAEGEIDEEEFNKRKKELLK